MNGVAVGIGRGDTPAAVIVAVTDDNPPQVILLGNHSPLHIVFHAAVARGAGVGGKGGRALVVVQIVVEDGTGGNGNATAAGFQLAAGGIGKGTGVAAGIGDVGHLVACVVAPFGDTVVAGGERAHLSQGAITTEAQARCIVAHRRQGGSQLVEIEQGVRVLGAAHPVAGSIVLVFGGITLGIDHRYFAALTVVNPVAAAIQRGIRSRAQRLQGATVQPVGIAIVIRHPVGVLRGRHQLARAVVTVFGEVAFRIQGRRHTAGIVVEGTADTRTAEIHTRRRGTQGLDITLAGGEGEAPHPALGHRHTAHIQRVGQLVFIHTVGVTGLVQLHIPIGGVYRQRLPGTAADRADRQADRRGPVGLVQGQGQLRVDHRLLLQPHLVLERRVHRAAAVHSVTGNGHGVIAVGQLVAHQQVHPPGKGTVAQRGRINPGQCRLCTDRRTGGVIDNNRLQPGDIRRLCRAQITLDGIALQRSALVGGHIPVRRHTAAAVGREGARQSAQQAVVGRVAIAVGIAVTGRAVLVITRQRIPQVDTEVAAVLAHRHTGPGIGAAGAAILEAGHLVRLWRIGRLGPADHLILRRLTAHLDHEGRLRAGAAVVVVQCQLDGIGGTGGQLAADGQIHLAVVAAEQLRPGLSRGHHRAAAVFDHGDNFLQRRVAADGNGIATDGMAAVALQ